MRIAAFSKLTDQERRRFLETVSTKGLPPAFADVAEMETYLLGPAFETGDTYLTLWADEAPAGAVGVVVREIGPKGEVFLTLLYVFAADADAVVGRLLQEAYAVIARFGGSDGNTVVKIGVGAGESHLQTSLERAGCRTAYRILNMVRPVEGALPAGGAVEFHPLTPDNAGDYLTVQNAAFLTSPNGAQLVPEQVEQMRQVARSPQFLQVGYAAGQPAVVLEVDVRGEVGQIHTVGVAPAFQGRGLGRTAVARALEVVAEGGAREAQLQVVEVNRSAVQLYLACGFVVNRVVSLWYYGPTPV